jgi:hypothetical protein
MTYEKPFYVRGIKVSVDRDGKSVTVYHQHSDVTEVQKLLIDNVIQYLIDEHFVKVNTCRVNIHCEEN